MTNLDTFVAARFTRPDYRAHVSLRALLWLAVLNALLIAAVLL